MKLRDLLAGIRIENPDVDLDVDISSIASDSRQVRDGSLFISIRGLVADGHRYLSEAIKRGAVAALVEKKVECDAPGGFPLVEVANTRNIQGEIAARFYGNPADSLKIIAVTGTNGKTTTTYLIRSILKVAGLKTALVGTVRYYIDDEELPAMYTTPDALELQQLLAEMSKKGVSHLVMEVSSHALELDRLSGCKPDVGIFTNLTRDHLDFHKDMEFYFEAKKKLFTGLDRDALAILNWDDLTYNRLKDGIICPVLSYGFSDQADIVCQGLELHPEGLRLTIRTPAGECKIQSRFLGRFNAYNILAAVSCAHGMGIDPELIAHGIEEAPAVPGRMEQVEGSEGFTVVVDYAHTDDALMNILSTCREFCSGRLTILFGCGGDRDRGKRSRMGEVAGKLSDYTILTSDNPRTEDPLLILEEIETGIKTTGGDYQVIPDRKEAIQQAIHSAHPGDVVILAGKGHEDYQIIGERRIPFDDRLIAAEAIKKIERGVNLHT